MKGGRSWKLGWHQAALSGFLGSAFLRVVKTCLGLRAHLSLHGAVKPSWS
jgi:hypothetical protein